MRLIRERRISRVAVVDDDPRAREGYGYPIEDAQLEPVYKNDPLPSITETTAQLVASIDAVLCDEHLKKHNYATFNGAELAASLYKQGVPAILCTNWEKADLEGIRPFRRQIPSLLTPHDLSDESLVQAIDLIIAEFEGKFSAQRRPWRTQIHFVEVERHSVAIEIPARDSQILRIQRDVLPLEFGEHLREGLRAYAKVNLGAESSDELFFTEWELRSHG